MVTHWSVFAACTSCGTESPMVPETLATLSLSRMVLGT